MTQFTRVNGDFLPVAVYDASTGNAYTNSGNINATSSGNTVQPQGPQLQFFTLTGNGDILTTYANAVFSAVEQLATVMIYEVTDTTDNTIAFATYPANGWDLTNGGSNAAFQLDAAVTAALAQAGASNTTVTVASTATFTN